MMSGRGFRESDNKTDMERLVPAVLAIATDTAAAKAMAAKALAFVERRQRETMAELRRSLSV